MNTYIVTRAHDNSEFEVEADRVERQTTTGYVNFYAGTAPNEELVASLINVSFRKAAD